MERINHCYKTIFLTVSAFLIIMSLLPSTTYAQSETPKTEVKFKAKITRIEEASCPQDYGEGNCLFAELEILNGSRKGEVVNTITRIDDDPRLEYLHYEQGDKVYLVEGQIADQTHFFIKEPIRYPSIFPLLVIFVLVVIIIGGIQGFSSLIGLGLTFVIILGLIIPMMLSGNSPILVSIIGGALMLTTAVYLSHGFNRKSSIALLGTISALLISAILAVLYTEFVKLTGYSSDDATFLAQSIDKEINIRGILLASLILGSIGVLDDVTVGQASIVFELHKANPSLSAKELFARAMNVGKDHIASMVNTLVLAYTAASLPLVMLFVAYSASLEEIINTELISEEIVRTLVGSIGLVLSLPITTFLACYYIGTKMINNVQPRLQK